MTGRSWNWVGEDCIVHGFLCCEADRLPWRSIGELAVNGTVNDLAMCGARPSHLSAAFILEEGFPIEDLWNVVLAMQRAAQAAGVLLVTATRRWWIGEMGRDFHQHERIGLVREGTNIRPRGRNPAMLSSSMDPSPSMAWRSCR